MSATTDNIKLTLNGDDVFEAYSIGEMWNGWVTPLFTFEQVIKVKEWFESAEQGTITYDANTDSFVVKYADSGEVEIVAGTDSFERVRVYEWASFGWTWDFAEETN